MRGSLPFVVAGLALALGLAVLVSPWADPDPDGLERVAEAQGFAETARDHDLSDSPFADYAVRGVSDERLSTGLAGLVGALLTFGVGSLLFGLLRRRREDRAPAESRR